MVKSAYIHIPFCKSKCKYCSFVSFNRLDLVNDYVCSLIEDIKANYKGENLRTLYFGGGTPSLLPLELVEKVISHFNFTKDYELTLEINPDDANIEYLKTLRDYGVNRLSIGSQTFDDEILQLIGRRHNSEQIVNCVNSAKKAGFENISLDLIYGLPGQSTDSLKRDIDRFLELDIQHISTYGLKIEEDSYWGRCGYDDVPNDDEQADMYELINETLEEEGFYRYEVSNFAKPGFESRHNLNYWDNSEYYGFGAAAHGYVDGIRYSKCSKLEQYIDNPFDFESRKTLTTQEQLEEEIFLGFRKRSGINVESINKKYNIDFNQKYKNILNKYSDYINKTTQGYSLNLQGVLISNVILSEFL